MQCERVKKLLEAFIEGELDDPRKKTIESHIASCQNCKRELELTRRIHQAIVCLPTPPVPEDIIPDTLRRTRQIPITRWRLLKSSGTLLARRWPIVVTAMLLIGLIMFGISYQWFNAKPDYTEEQIASAAEDLKLALAIVAVGTQKAQNAALAEGARTFGFVKNASEDAIQAVYKANQGVSEKLKNNLDFISQLQFEEEQ